MRSTVMWLSALLLAGLHAAGADIDADKPPPPAFDIVGVWRYTGPGFTCDLEFAHAGVFRGYLSPNAGEVWSFRGRWSMVGDRLFYTYTASTSAHRPEGSEDEDQILEVTATHLRLRNRFGEVHRYNRIAKLEPPARPRLSP